MELEPAVRNFSATKVVVVGDVMLDVYVEGRADRVCREAPVPRLSVATQRVAQTGSPLPSG